MPYSKCSLDLVIQQGYKLTFAYLGLLLDQLVQKQMQLSDSVSQSIWNEKKKSKVKRKKYKCNNVSKMNMKTKSNLDMEWWVKNMTCIIEAI